MSLPFQFHIQSKLQPTADKVTWLRRKSSLPKKNNQLEDFQKREESFLLIYIVENQMLMPFLGMVLKDPSSQISR